MDVCRDDVRWPLRDGEHATTSNTVTGEESVMIRPHQTGHITARDGSLLRVDVMSGSWVATRYAPNLVVTHRVVGTDESVHDQVRQWS
jgi:hypothetical protein